MAADDRRDNRDLVLAPNQYAHVSDETKGEIVCYTGPYKASLANEQRPVLFNTDTKNFDAVPLEKATRTFAIAPEGWYGILKNPSAKEPHHPEPGTQISKTLLHVGRKVNMPGPFSFALYPGQMIKVVRGHILSSNQYLLTRVYDADEAQKNIGSTITAASTLIITEAFDKLPPDADEDAKAKAKALDAVATDAKREQAARLATKNLSMGALSIIKGTDVSFYIPPTGIEVVPDENGKYIRDAVTLEQLEYCILVAESGDKRYERGPQVVFPEPTEDFIRSAAGTIKFRAYELNDNMGLHIKIVDGYTDDNGVTHATGEEIFITGKEQRIYFPRVEHMIIKYGNKQSIHYAVAVPKGDGRYVLNKDTSEIRLVRGPNMLLPDPTKEVLVKRILSDRQCELWFPGNAEALEYNRMLRKASSDAGLHQQFVAEDILSNAGPSAGSRGLHPHRASMAMYSSTSFSVGSSGTAEGDRVFERNASFTPPRSITLDNKFEGAVICDIWPGYAVQRVSKTGERTVIVGPTTFLLEFDEGLQPLEMSTGKPKSDSALIRTPYLKVLNNRVTDVVRVVTSDLVEVDIRVNYNSNFTGDPNSWFMVDNYVKLMTQECRSMIRSAAKKIGIQELMDGTTELVRDTILGVKKPDSEDRPGHLFKENGVHIYGVDVLTVDIIDTEIRRLLEAAQHETVHNTLKILQSAQKANLVEATTRDTRRIEQMVHDTTMVELEHKQEKAERLAEQAMSALEARAKASAKERELEEAALEMRKKIEGFNAEMLQTTSDIRTKSIKEQFAAITPDLIAALIAVGDKQLATTMMENLPKASGEIGTLLGIGGMPALLQTFKGTPVEKVLLNMGAKDIG